MYLTILLKKICYLKASVIKKVLYFIDLGKLNYLFERYLGLVEIEEYY
jgi:hypothetical protein